MSTLRSSFYVVLWPSILLAFLAQSNSKPFTDSSPYLSPTTILNYHKLLQNFRVFMYEPNVSQFNFATQVESLFYTSLRDSTFLTQNPDEAHLFFLPPFSPDRPRRSLARLISRIRTRFPYWSRSLGADHFFLSCNGIPRDADRNLVELKKNAIQIWCFPTQNDKFIPHKDVTLPPIPGAHAPHALPNRAEMPSVSLVNDREFVIESEPLDAERLGNASGSRFCLFEYGNDVSLIGEAMRLGCVPVVVFTEGGLPNDMPFMDVVRWGDMAVFVSVKKSGEGVNVKVKEEVKRVLGGDTWRERHEYMRGLGVAASKHLMWNQPLLPFDAFNTVMYQLWLRRHVVRYATSMQ